MIRLNVRPAPLSHVSVTGLPTPESVRSALQSVASSASCARPSRSRSRPNRRRAARRREQADVRALGIDRLVISLEHDIVDLAALQVDRTADARRVDRHSRACRQDLFDRLGAVAAGAPGGVAATGAGRRSCRCAARLRFGRRSGYWPGWPPSAPGARADTGTGVEILPGGHHQDRQRDREKQVSRVLGFMFARLCPSSVRLAGPRPRLSASPRRAARKACGHPRRARRNGGPAPRAGPSARNRDHPAPQEASQRAGLFQPSADAIAHDRAADAFGHCQSHARARDGFFPGSSRRRDCKVKVSTENGDRARRAETRPAWSGDQSCRRGRARHPHARRQGSLPRRLHRHANGRTAAKPKRADQAESFLRPRARRAASTLRPPTVAERARKP